MMSFSLPHHDLARCEEGATREPFEDNDVEKIGLLNNAEPKTSEPEVKLTFGLLRESGVLTLIFAIFLFEFHLG